MRDRPVAAHPWRKRVLVLALVVLPLFPFSAFVIHARRRSLRVAEPTLMAAMNALPTDDAKERYLIKTLRAQRRLTMAVRLGGLVVPLFWTAVFAAVGRRAFALRA